MGRKGEGRGEREVKGRGGREGREEGALEQNPPQKKSGYGPNYCAPI